MGKIWIQNTYSILNSFHVYLLQNHTTTTNSSSDIKRILLDEMIWWNDSKFTIYLEYKHTHCIFFLFQVILSYFPSIKYAQLVWDSCQHRIGNSLGETIKYITKWKTKKKYLIFVIGAKRQLHYSVEVLSWSFVKRRVLENM